MLSTHFCTHLLRLFFFYKTNEPQIIMTYCLTSNLSNFSKSNILLRMQAGELCKYGVIYLREIFQSHSDRNTALPSRYTWIHSSCAIANFVNYASILKSCHANIFYQLDLQSLSIHIIIYESLHFKYQ